MKNEIFDNMLSRYDLATEQQKRNAIFEVNQQVTLAGLYAGGFFESAAFYGGTCLRIFHGLQRFSEDMDFSLLTQDDKFDFTKYFPAIIDAFTMVGREVEIKKKDKRNFGKFESAFLKDNYCCPLKVSEQRDIHPQCCCNGIADDFSEGKPLS